MDATVLLVRALESHTVASKECTLATVAWLLAVAGASAGPLEALQWALRHDVQLVGLLLEHGASLEVAQELAAALPDRARSSRLALLQAWQAPDADTAIQVAASSRDEHVLLAVLRHHSHALQLRGNSFKVLASALASTWTAACATECASRAVGHWLGHQRARLCPRGLVAWFCCSM
mmetsp:Transcript_14991/g.37404  ORF Transcript_14991/g.37404 Transcript_14991/m.37404 type:complete len:177 (-) Transcript_14991:78-608(-)